MIIGSVAVLVTGAMLLSGGAALALQSPQGKRAGIAMSLCGGILVLPAALALCLFLGVTLHG